MTPIDSMPFPILTSKRLTLRQLSTDNHQEILTLRSDPEINKYLNRQPAKTSEDAITFINTVNATIENGNSLYWAITLKEQNIFAGTICLFDFATDNPPSCEIGYELIPKFQGKGIMHEALQAVITYAFQNLKLQKLIAITHCENINSTRLLIKSNFVKSDEIHEANADLTIYTLTV